MPHIHAGGLESLQVPLTAILLLTAWAYLRGWRRLRASSTSVVSARCAVSFLVGLFLIWVAVGSPLATLDHEWLTVHMIQHLLLLSAAPPLIWIGAPSLPILHGRIARTIAHPASCWLAAALTLTVWHVPAALALSMQSNAWHLVQHASFLAAGLLFWRPVVQSWSRARTDPEWSMVIYLFLATLPCDVLAGFLVFSERIAYPTYLVTSGRSEASVLADQQYAGALMWTCVTLIYLTAAAMLSMRLLGTDTITSASSHVPEHHRGFAERFET